MKPARRDSQRRVTPALIDFHIAQARELRRQAYRDVGRALWALLVRLKRLVL